MANLKVGKKFKLNGDTVQVVSINADGTATLNYAAGSGKTGFAGKVALNVGSKSASGAKGNADFDTDDIEVDDAVVTLDAYNDFKIPNPVEKDPTDRMNAEELAYYGDHLGYDPDDYFKKNKKEILAKRAEYADGMNADRKEVADYKAGAAKYDENLLKGYQKDGYREFKLGRNRKFTDSSKYDDKTLKGLGFGEEAYKLVNRPNVDGSAPSKELVEMRTAFLANASIYDRAVKEFNEFKPSMFANDYDKWKPRYEAMYKAEEAYRKMEFYAEMTNRAEAAGKGYKTTGYDDIESNKNKRGLMTKARYTFIDGGVPYMEDLHENKIFAQRNNSHYVWMDTNNRGVMAKDKNTPESRKARDEAYRKFRKDSSKDWVDPEG